jgi:PKD repeat protein
VRNALAHYVAGSVAFLVICGIPAITLAETRTIRVVTYNIQADTGTFTTPRPGLITPSSGGSVTNGGVLEGIGEEILAGNSQPIDVLALQETTSNAITVQPIVNGLNTFYSVRNIPAGYAMSTYQATESGGFTGSGNGPNALVYNTNTVQLVASVPVDPPGGISNLGSFSGMYREVMRYQFAPAGVTTNSTNTFFVYVSHYKASTGATNMGYRNGEAAIIRTNAAALPSDARVLYTGDFNASNSSEPMYQTLVATGVNQGFDPINPSGTSGINWGTFTTNTNILKTLSESATNLRYRDDYHMMTSNVLYGVGDGLALVPGTYHVFGVNGTTPYNGSVISNSNTSLNNLNTNGVGITAAQLRTNLTTATDHLPVVADYTIPVPASSPVASFTGSPTNGVEPLAVTFTDNSTGSITNRFWDFGDSSTTNVTTNIVVHTYADGTYNVTLIVSGSGGADTNTKPSYISVLTAFQSWQIQYFGSTNNPSADPNADPDGDGQNNMAEFPAGTDPTNGASAFQVLSVLSASLEDIITWSSVSNKVYQPQLSSTLTTAVWQNVSSPVTAGVSQTSLTITNEPDPTLTNRFYRILLVPPP